MIPIYLVSITYIITDESVWTPVERDENTDCSKPIHPVLECYVTGNPESIVIRRKDFKIWNNYYLTETMIAEIIETVDEREIDVVPLEWCESNFGEYKKKE
jgi:hypothetical protein